MDRLAAPSTTPVNVVVQGPPAEIDRIAATYGVRVVKRMDMGAVVSGSPAEVRAVAGDSNVGSLTGDDVVVSTMAVSTQSTGASQLWRGADGTSFGGLVGSGVGVVVIDSGIGLHPDVDRRVKLRVDFVNDHLGNPDVFGHGTHVASLIAGSGAGSRGSDGAAYIGMAPGAELVSLRVLDARRLRPRVRRRSGPRVGDQEQGSVSAARRESVAGSCDEGTVPDRADGPCR